MSRPRRREAPVRRINPSGRPVWLARFTNAQGRRKSTGTYSTKREAQQAIDDAYGRRERVDTLGDYFKRWPQLHPRAARTQATNEHRITRVLAVELEGVRLENWPLADLRRRHAHELVDVMLRHQGRAAAGAQNILRALSAMAEDAITDEAAELNAFRGVTVRQSDPRVRKAPKRPRVFSWAEMHHFADACGQHEAMVRLLADCGLRLGELLPLGHIQVTSPAEKRSARGLSYGFPSRRSRVRPPSSAFTMLPPEDTDFVVKARHSVFYTTPLEYLLRQREVDHLVLAGQVTEQCILYSALDAYVRHFEVTVARDGVAHVDEGRADAALELMKRNMDAEIAPCADCTLANRRKGA